MRQIICRRIMNFHLNSLYWQFFEQVSDRLCSSTLLLILSFVRSFVRFSFILSFARWLLICLFSSITVDTLFVLSLNFIYIFVTMWLYHFVTTYVTNSKRATGDVCISQNQISQQQSSNHYNQIQFHAHT